MAIATAETSNAQRTKEVRRHWQQIAEVPHTETMLATLLNVHIVGGTTDLSLHLEGATLRPNVVHDLIEILRSTGYPGYEEHGPNSKEAVRVRVDQLYRKPYANQERFIPRAIDKAITAAWEEQRGRASLIVEKCGRTLIDTLAIGNRRRAERERLERGAQ